MLSHGFVAVLDTILVSRYTEVTGTSLSLVSGS